MVDGPLWVACEEEEDEEEHSQQIPETFKLHFPDIDQNHITRGVRKHSGLERVGKATGLFWLLLF